MSWLGRGHGVSKLASDSKVGAGGTAHSLHILLAILLLASSFSTEEVQVSTLFTSLSSDTADWRGLDRFTPRFKSKCCQLQPKVNRLTTVL